VASIRFVCLVSFRAALTIILHPAGHNAIFIKTTMGRRVTGDIQHRNYYTADADKL